MLLFMDGMAHYNTAGLGVKWTQVDSAYCAFTVVTEGRFGHNCIKRTSTSNQGGNVGHLVISPFATRGGIWTPTKSGVCGFALKIDDLNRVGTYTPTYEPCALFSILSGNTHHIKVQLNPNGTFVLTSYAHEITGSTIILAQSVEGMQSNAWAYLEFKWLIDGTVGTFELRVNTIPVMTFSGDTYQAGAVAVPSEWNAIGILAVISQVPPYLVMRMSDFYLADLTGGAADVKDFLGDGVIETIFPNGPGLAAGWAPVDGAPNWDQVNDKPAPDGDATYVETAIPGVRDCHQFEDIPAGAQILGVHYNMLVRKLDDGTVTVKPIVGQGGVQYDGPTQGVASNAYDRYLTQPYDVNPATGAKWTAAEINAGQWGIKKEA